MPVAHAIYPVAADGTWSCDARDYRFGPFSARRSSWPGCRSWFTPEGRLTPLPKSCSFQKTAAFLRNPSACADTPELSRPFGTSSSSETSFLSSNKCGNSECQWFSGRGGSTTVAMAYELRFHVIQVVLVWLPLVVHSRRPVDTPAKQLQFPEDCGFSTDPSACADTTELSRPFGTSSSSETSFLSSNKCGNSECQWFSGRGGSTTVAMAYELRFHVIQVVLVWLPLVVHSRRPVDTPAKQLQFPEDCGFSTDPSACADTPELSRPFGTSSSSETSFLSSNKCGNSECQWFSGRGGSTTVAMAYELRFHVIQVVLVWLPLVVHSRRPVDTPAKQLQFPEDCGFSTDPSACADTTELSRPFGTSSSSETSFLSSNKCGNSECQWFSGRGGSTTVAMAYELRFHVIQVVLVWLPLVVHSRRPVDTPAKQLQFPEDCGFSTDPSACADTPELSRPFGTSSSSETSFLSSNKCGNSECQWFSGRGGSTTVAMAYELRFHVIQVVLVWRPLVVHSRRPVDTPAKQLQFPEDCGFSTDPNGALANPKLAGSHHKLTPVRCKNRQRLHRQSKAERGPQAPVSISASKSSMTQDTQADEKVAEGAAQKGDVPSAAGSKATADGPAKPGDLELAHPATSETPRLQPLHLYPGHPNILLHL
ncbi:hypothetical protein MRX96_045691 [Rhipicephalus microplus]